MPPMDPTVPTEPPVRRTRPPVATLTLLATTLVGLALAIWLGPGTGGPDDAPTIASSENWPADAVVYHVFVDRFADGDAPETQVAGTPEDPGYAKALTDWMGGDLAGVLDRLDHIVASGANTIWLSPVTPGPYFHGYHPTDLTDVDPRFGDVGQLRDLVAAAHERGLRVVYDLVLNHTSDQHPWFVAAQADCDGSPFVAYYRFTACPERYDAFAALPELPQLNADHPPFRDHVRERVLPFWLDEIGVDGFRLDHVEGPSRDFWRFVNAELDARWPGTLLIGEVWSQQATIDSYGEELDAATAFPFRDRLVTVFAGGGAVPAVSLAVANGLDDTGFPREESPLPATYLSSHDQPRFTHEAGGDTARTALAYRTVLTLPGLPVVYYGDEVGLSQTDSLPDGAPFQDRWFREPMPWDRSLWDEQLHAAVASVARLRTTTPALHAGSYTDHLADGPLWVFERTLDGDRLVVVVNTSAEAVVVDLDASLAEGAQPPAGSGFRDLLGDEQAVLGSAIEVPAFDLRILRVETPAA
jgi:cyclomaltodextrinase / maltogenic alpha-amylase / neopullulanase